MKVELINHPKKGPCILISEIDINNIKEYIEIRDNKFLNGIKDPAVIASFISTNQKIAAIKELRAQTGWGLKESKEYIDRYLDDNPNFQYKIKTYHSEFVANQFIKDHTREDFIKSDDMML